MKYEFHVGDYVETVEGKKGYLLRCVFLSDGHIVFYVQYNNEKFYPCEVREDSLRYRFVRIGQYDFTKKDEGKIEPLCEEYTKSFPIYKTTTTGNDSKCRSIDIGTVSKKINELVDVVNELKTDYEKHLQAHELTER